MEKETTAGVRKIFSEPKAGISPAFVRGKAFGIRKISLIVRIVLGVSQIGVFKLS